MTQPVHQIDAMHQSINQKYAPSAMKIDELTACRSVRQVQTLFRLILRWIVVEN